MWLIFNGMLIHAHQLRAQLYHLRCRRFAAKTCIGVGNANCCCCRKGRHSTGISFRETYFNGTEQKKNKSCAGRHRDRQLAQLRHLAFGWGFPHVYNEIMTLILIIYKLLTTHSPLWTQRQKSKLFKLSRNALFCCCCCCCVFCALIPKENTQNKNNRLPWFCVFFFYSSKSVVFFINSVVETIVSANWITSNENNLRTSSAYWNHFAHGVAFT